MSSRTKLVALFVAALSSASASAAPIVFGPPTWVDLQRIGMEPQMQVDRRGNGRVYVSAPTFQDFTSTTTRSLDGGDTFRTLFDRSCASNNSTIHCDNTSGGDVTVALAPDSDNVYTAQQSDLVYGHFFAGSHDSGDSFPYVTILNPLNTDADRPWLAGAGAQTVYYNFFGDARDDNHLAGAYFQISTDGGATFSASPTPSFDASASGSPIVVDTSGGRWNGALYQFFGDPAAGKKWADDGLGYRGQIAVSTDFARSFVIHDTPLHCDNYTMSWLSIDTKGNLYALCEIDTPEGRFVMLSTSWLGDPANAAAPGSKWSAPVRVSVAPAQTTLLGSVMAGTPGRVAIVYYGASPHARPDLVLAGTEWHAYLSFSTDALCQWRNACTLAGVPQFAQQPVDRRPVILGPICIKGGGCAVDVTHPAELCDLLDVGYDSEGRMLVTWTDANGLKSPRNHAVESMPTRPQVRVSRQLSGPGLLAGKTVTALPEPHAPIADAAGDARWPDTASGTNVAGVDVKQLRISNQGTALTFQIQLGDVKQFDAAIKTVANSTASFPKALAGDRLMLVVRFETDRDEYFVAYEHVKGGADRAFSGHIDALDQPLIFPPDIYGTGVTFVQDDRAAFSVDPLTNTVKISQDLSKLGNLPAGAKLLSAVAASVIAPPEDLVTFVAMPMVIDATRAVDYGVGP